ncbi:MAG TPA: STAS domain-containing protein [Kouleothrix sp.]|nr:STAS domain-containing protein [Kouleothrix sp.]
MRRWLDWLLTVNSPDENIRRRGRNIIYIILGLLVLMLFIAVAWTIITPVSIIFVFATVLPTLTYFGMLVLVRRGYVDTAAVIIFMMQLTVSVYILTSSFEQPWSVMMLITPLLFASVSLRAWQIWIAFIAIAIARVFINTQTRDTTTDILIFQIITFAVFTLMLFLGTRSLEQSLQQSDELRHVAEGSSNALAAANDNLEQAVNNRTADLQHALSDVRERELRLTQTLQKLSVSQELVRSLSAPIIPILPSVIVVPLAGILDGEQVQRLMQQVLERISAQRSRDLILDITGVPIMDSHVANVVIQIAQAVKLLGTRTLLVGVRPEVAQTLVALNIEFGDLEIFADLQDAVLSRLGQLTQSKASNMNISRKLKETRSPA